MDGDLMKVAEFAFFHELSKGGDHRSALRKAIEAFSEEGGISLMVKPLSWEDYGSSFGNKIYAASVPLGSNYLVFKGECLTDDGKFSWVSDKGDDDEAKSVAMSHYRERIMSAFYQSPLSG